MDDMEEDVEGRGVWTTWFGGLRERDEGEGGRGEGEGREKYQ